MRGPMILSLWVLGVSLVLAASPVMAGVKYACTFTLECEGTERPCAPGWPIEVVLEEKADFWKFWGPDEIYAELRPVPGGSEEFRSWQSLAFSQGYETVTLLSIGADGRAILTTQGAYLPDQVFVQTGICERRDGQ